MKPFTPAFLISKSSTLNYSRSRSVAVCMPILVAAIVTKLKRWKIGRPLLSVMAESSVIQLMVALPLNCTYTSDCAHTTRHRKHNSCRLSVFLRRNWASFCQALLSILTSNEIWLRFPFPPGFCGHRSRRSVERAVCCATTRDEIFSNEQQIYSS